MNEKETEDKVRVVYEKLVDDHSTFMQDWAINNAEMMGMGDVGAGAIAAGLGASVGIGLKVLGKDKDGIDKLREIFIAQFDKYIFKKDK